MKTDQIINELLEQKSEHVTLKKEPLRQWFTRTAEIWAVKRAGPDAGQDFASDALEKAIDALQRRPGLDIKHPKLWLRDLITKVWSTDTRSYAREQERYELGDVVEEYEQASGFSADERAAVRARNKARRAERMRQLEESKKAQGVRTLKVKDKRGVERSVEGALTKEEYDERKQDRWAEPTPTERAMRGLDPYGPSQWRA